ncbi:MAG TPA: hypothetical protein PKL78_10965 [Anaerolineales bacterium]|nr:hypothetical protein [Anaerolineales bacterium]HNN14072.1 hypothetical protein [Anaerolineales bacterium]
MNRSFQIQLLPFLKNVSLKRGAIFGFILVCALLAFEVFNFGTTSFALRDVLGDLQFAGVYWSSILAFAFCTIDFAGIARIFTPEQGRDEPAEVYYLFGAWLLAAAFNAMLTWWGVSVAIQTHTAQGGVLLGQATMLKVVPIFVASMVWLVRVLLIGTFSVAGERLFTLADVYNRYSNQRSEPATYNAPQPRTSQPAPRQQVNPPAANYPRPVPKPHSNPVPAYGASRAEPTYHPVGMSAMSNGDQNPSVRR